MLNEKTLNNFTQKANHVHQEFCVWMYVNNEFAKHQIEWNKTAVPRKFFKLEEFSREKGCKYKNFWDVVIPSLQHNWILSLARIFDPAYHSRDKKKNKPRLSLDYILELLDDVSLAKIIRNKIKKYQSIIQSLKIQRDNFLAHNDVNFNFKNTKIKAGVENLFKELDNAILEIKKNKKHLENCNNLNLKYTEVLSRCGVDEIFEALLRN